MTTRTRAGTAMGWRPLGVRLVRLVRWCGAVGGGRAQRAWQASINADGQTFWIKLARPAD